MQNVYATIMNFEKGILNNTANIYCLDRQTSKVGSSV